MEAKEYRKEWDETFEAMKETAAVAAATAVVADPEPRDASTLAAVRRSHMDDDAVMDDSLSGMNM